MGNGRGLSRGDRNRDARLARLRELVPLSNAIAGVDLADDTQAAVVTDHDSRVIARRRVSARAWELGELLDWAVARSASSHASMMAAYGPIAGRARLGYAFRGGGTALASAWRTVRRCTRCLTASSRIDNPLTRRPRLICSNSPTRDRAIPDLHADSNDVKIRSKVGPTFATTRRPTSSRDHHPGGATIRDERRPNRGQFR